MIDREHVIVVGAGIAGLVIAHDLAYHAVPVTVLESADRVGGQLAALDLEGIEVDAAADSYPVRSTAVAELAAELGLETVAPLDAPEWLIGADGEAQALPAASVLGIPAVPLAADVLAVIGTAGGWRALVDRFAPIFRPDKYASLGDLVGRRMGRRVLERLVDPVVRGVHSTSAAQLPIEVAAPDLRAALRRTGSLAAAVGDLRATSPAGSQVAGIRGGVYRLAARLAEQAIGYGAEIRTGAQVAEVTQNAVVTADGERLLGRVVVAAPGIASKPTRQREVTVATALLEAPGLDDAPRGTGALIAELAPGIQARAFTHTSAKWPWLGERLPEHRHVVRLAYDRAPEDPDARVLADLRAITGAEILGIADLRVETWVRTLTAVPRSRPADVGEPGPRLAGEAASDSGLATIVPRARALAADLIEGTHHDGIH